jgi:hypothetical protein
LFLKSPLAPLFQRGDAKVCPFLEGDVNACLFPEGDNKDDSHIFMKFLRTHLPEDPKYQGGEESRYNRWTVLAWSAAHQASFSVEFLDQDVDGFGLAGNSVPGTVFHLRRTLGYS